MFGSRRLLDFHHQAVGFRLFAHREIRTSTGFEHNPAHAFAGLCDANSRQQRISDFDGFSEQAGCETGVVDINVDPFRIAQAVGLVLHLALRIDNHGAGIRRGHVPDTSHELSQRRAGIRTWRRIS